MSDAPKQAQPGQLISIGEVAARNIASVLNLPAEHIKTIEGAIRDEIQAMSSHFTLAVADVQTAHEVAEATMKKEYEASVAEIKDSFNWLKANRYTVGVVTGLVAGAGYAIGAIVHFI